MAIRPVGAPPAKGIGDWRAAEENALTWLKWLGHPGARRTGEGSDGGIDLIATGAFGQVKWQGKAVSRVPLQSLHGARANRPGTLYFFTNAGYSKPALTYAESVGMAAFTYDVENGLISPASSTAARIFEASKLRHQPQPKSTDLMRRADEHKRQRSSGTAASDRSHHEFIQGDIVSEQYADLRYKRNARTRPPDGFA